MSKLWTWASALWTAATGLVFWSPGSFRRSRRFVHHVNRFAFIERHKNPQLRTVSAKTVLEGAPLEGLQLKPYGAYCGQTPLEILVLCSLAMAHQPRVILEIGTFRGLTTLLLALNTPETTRVITVDLPSGSVETTYPLTEPGLVAKRGAQSTLWEQHGVHHRIRQILCDSAALQPADIDETIDFAFVDGSHSYEYVKSDTELVQQVLTPSGIILWDDFNVEKPGVFRYLNELASEKRLVHIDETDLVLYDPTFDKVDDPDLLDSTSAP